jgi:hypothetical protein
VPFAKRSFLKEVRRMRLAGLRRRQIPHARHMLKQKIKLSLVSLSELLLQDLVEVIPADDQELGILHALNGS